jgi:short-subunit dehydrogenase
MRSTASSTQPVAIVAGGCREVVRELARRGYAIVVVYLDDQSRAEAVVEEIIAAHGAAVAVRADLTDDLDVERLFAETIAAFGGVDLVAHPTVRNVSIRLERVARQLGDGVAIVGASTAQDVADFIGLLDRRRPRL